MVARISKFTRYVSRQSKMAPPAREQCTAVLPDRIGLPKQALRSRAPRLYCRATSASKNGRRSVRSSPRSRMASSGGSGTGGTTVSMPTATRKAKVKAKGVFPYAFPTLMNWGWVAGSVATSLRREVLSWSHHALIASYPPDEQKKWLDKAERFEWPVKKL